MREYFQQTKRLIRVVSLMVGKKYSRILCLVRPIFVLIENTYAFRTTISAQYFLVRHTHAFFTTFLVILRMVQNTHSFFAIFLWYENNAKNGRKSSRFCPNDDQLLWTSLLHICIRMDETSCLFDKWQWHLRTVGTESTQLAPAQDRNHSLATIW